MTFSLYSLVGSQFKRSGIHGRLKLSNILLNDSFYPLVSDPFLYELDQQTSKPMNLLISMSKEALVGSISNKSDIYSFGRLILQLLTRQLNIYSDITEDLTEIEQYIKNGTKPTIPSFASDNMRTLISECLSDNPNDRPSAHKIVAALEKEFSNVQSVDAKSIEEFKNFLNPQNKSIDPKIADFKRLADQNNDVKMMYAYGRARCLGEHCKKDFTEGLHYLKLAKNKGYSPASTLYDALRQTSTTNIGFENSHLESGFSANEPQEISPKEQQQSTEFVHLFNDQYFESEKVDYTKIMENVEKNYNQPRKFQFKDKLVAALKERNFIFTEKAQERLTTLYNYLEAGIPVILEGPTGTSKTLSSEIVCELSERRLIRFNLSSETKTADLLGRYVGDSNSWAGISHVKGPFINAFENGYTLLLDEINLASPECLQFIEETLDSGIISVELPGMPLQEIHMHENFRLIATQNPNKGAFANKRQDLGVKFLSRFQVINFPAFTIKELKDIADGLAKGFNYQCKPQLIDDLIEFTRNGPIE